MKRVLVGVAVLAVAAVGARGASVRPLTEGERGLWAANEVVTFTHADLTNAAVAGTQTVTDVFSVFSNQLVTCVGAVLVTPFTVGTTTYTDSVTLEVGDGTDVDLYLASMELAEDSTEVRVKLGRAEEAALTGTTRTYTNVVYESLAVTGNVSVTTYTVATTRYGQKLYSADDTVDFRFTADANQTLLALTAGEVQVFLRVTRTGDW